jgi:hypothetical protein
VEQPPSCGYRVQIKIQGLVGTPLAHAPPGVPRGSTTESQGMEWVSWGDYLVIGIACFTNPPPLMGDQTHTHTPRHFPTADVAEWQTDALSS